MTGKKIGIFGGTFNPPHIAHSIAAQSVMEELQLDKIIFIPSGNPPLKESIGGKQRMEMAILAFEDNEKFEVSDIEIQNEGEKSYTINTLKKMKKIYGVDTKLFLIIGADNLIQLPRWKEPEKLFELAEVIVINRPDYFHKNPDLKFYDKVKFADIPFMEISSSMIRENVKKGKSVRYLITEKVRRYIEENKLYSQTNF